MARRLRIQYSDAIYHVMARGNGRQDIVQDDADRGRLVACLERAVRRSGWSLYCLCLFDQSPPPGPQDASPQPRQGYATVPLVVRQWVDSSPPPLRAPLPGPLPDQLVEDETYLLVLTRYIHLNPVRAGLAATPEAWIWSSFLGYFRRRDRLDWLAHGALLRLGPARCLFRKSLASFLGLPLIRPGWV